MNDYTIETIESELTTIRIEQDRDCQNPRTDFDHAATMVCWNRRYDLGDKHNFSEPSEVQAYLKETKAIHLSLYLYDHGGITMSCSPFSCPWDSGQVGYIYMTADAIRKEYGCKRITKAIREKVIKLMQSEVKEYDCYLTGECYGYVIEDKEGNELESCWGFLGDIGYVKGEAVSSAEYIEKDLVSTSVKI
jgi:hypothetical protein